MVACLLAGCPDDDGRAAPAAAPTPALTGIVALGVPYESLELRAGGPDVSPRSTRVRSDGLYQLSSLGLNPPFVLSVPDTLTAASAVPVPVANLTPLTHLQLVEVLRAEPLQALANTFASRPGSTAVDYTPITVAAMDRARRRVVSLLAERLGVQLPATVANADFVTTPIVNSPGDPTYDALAALDTALAAQGSSLTLFVRARARELEPCRRFFLDLRIGDAVGEFCANTRTTTAGSPDRYRYTALDGGVLEVLAGGERIEAITLSQADGAIRRCDAAACAGASLSPAAVDGSRRLRFESLSLTADDGALLPVRLDGELGTARPGLPALDCDGATEDRQPLYLLGADGSVAGQCFALTPQPAGTRTIFRDFEGGALRLSVHADDTAPASIAIYRRDGNRAQTIYRCEGAACAGFVAGPVFARPGRLRNRELRLDGVRLARVDGEPGPAFVELAGGLIVTLGPDAEPPACTRSPPTELLRARVSTEAANWDICPPYDLSENGTVGVGRVGPLDYDGRYLGGIRYTFDNAVGIPGSLVVVTVLGVVRRVEYSRGRAIASETGRLDDELLLCEGFDCRGVEFDPARAQDGHAIRFNATVLVEQRYDGTPTERQVQLDGALRSAPDCLIGNRCRTP